MKESLFTLGCILALNSELLLPGQQDLPKISESIQEDVEQCIDNVSRWEPREFTVEEAQMLMTIAQAEAGNQGVAGMMLVMMVVLNRRDSDMFPDTIEEVIFQPGHFQPVSDGRYYKTEISAEAHLALAKIESGMFLDDKIIGFEISSNGRTLEKYFDYAYTFGDHDFYVAKEVKTDELQ